MALPQSMPGWNVMIACVLPGEPPKIVGGAGTPGVGTIAFEAALLGPAPTAFWAYTANV
jgi:hypothetical protein